MPDPKAKPPIQTVVFSEAENTVQLIGASGEWVAFEYLMRAEKGSSASVQVSMENFAGGGGGIPGSAIRMYRHGTVTVDRLPAWYLRSQGGRRSREFPDVLIPIDAAGGSSPISLESGKTTPIWVEFQIPPGTQAGRYTSTIHMRESGGGALKTLVSLRVRGFALPLASALPTPTRVSIRTMLKGDDRATGADVLGLMRDESKRAAAVKAFVALHEHGLSPFTDELLPAYTESVEGGVVIDWTAYDAVCGPLIDGSAYPDKRPAYIWPLPVTSQYPDPSRYEGAESTRYAAVVRDCLVNAKAHFESKGWGAQAVVMFDPPTAGLPKAGDGARVKRLGKLTHVADKSLLFVSSAIPQSMGPFGWQDYPHEDLTDCVDIWSPPARFQHPPTLAEQRARGKKTWLLPDRPPFSGSIAIEAPWTHPRSVPWQAFLHEHNALYLPGSTHWPDRFDRAIPHREESDATWLLYPGDAFGQGELLASVRLKQLRLGLQDYCYLKALADHGRGATAKVTVSSLIKAAGTDAYGDNYQDAQFDRRMDSVDAWYAASKLIEEELADVLGDKSAGGMDVENNRQAWGRMLDATRKVRATVDSAKLSRDTRGEKDAVLATFGVTVRSELPSVFSGNLKFGLLPIDWKNMSDATRVGPIEEMGTARARLVAGMSRYPACDLEGHLAVKMLLDVGKGETVETIGRLSVLYMGKVMSPIKLDGNLSDWPPTEGNVAGGYTVIAGGNADRPPSKSRTLAYFCQNEETVYIGIHADKPAATGKNAEAPSTTARFGNVVTYDDLMPVGEDLVELLFDPSGRAAAADDLYHVVIKASGQAIFEHGIEMTPPIGKSKPWISEQKFAIEAGEKSWSAEIAIPKSAFGRGASKMKIWGLNVTRLEPVRNEYSNWAGAQRHCYDPASLGNLVWP